MRVSLFHCLCLFILQGALSQCPSSTQPVYSNNQILSCQPQDKGRFGSFCQYSIQHSQYICCTSTSNQCPNGSPLLSNRGIAVSCYSDQNCGSGYTCVQQTCCANSLSALCSTSGTQCLDGQTLINGVCVNQVGLGALCQENAQCVGQSQCISGRCQCPTGYIASGGSCLSQPSCQLGTVSINGQCLSFSAPGYQCVANDQCIDRSQCLNSICTCPSTMRNVNGYCIQNTGGPCLQTQTLINNQCVTFSIIGGSCIADAQCVGETYCRNSICQCKEGTTAMYGYCITHSTVSCNTNQILVNGICYSLIPQGGFCMFQKQCMNNGQCMNGICVSIMSCNSNEVSLNGECHPLVQVGDSCYLLKQCADNAVCLNSICQCASGYRLPTGQCASNPCGVETQVLVNNQCFPIVEVGAQCSWARQCSGNSQCSNGICQCPSGSSQMNGQCTKLCGNNQVSIGNQCYPTAQIGSSCSFNQQCLGNSQCSNGFCRCPSGSSQMNGQCTNPCGNNQVSINNQCYPTAQIGSSCSFNQQCLGNSQCSNGFCRCPSGSSQMNGQCTNPCGNNQVSINNQCYPTAQIGSSCSFNQQCLGNSQCSNGFCRCPSGSSQMNGQCTNPCGNNQVSINNQCYPTAQIGSSCSFNQQCLGNSQCSNGFCRCPSGSSQMNGQCTNPCGNNQVSINNQCYPTAQIGSSCSFNQQCLGNSQCSNGFCQCPSGSSQMNGQCTNPCGNNQVSINNQCYPTAQIGSSCSFNQQCLGNSQCSNGFCQCPSGSSQMNGQCTNPCGNNQVSINNQCYPTAQIGSSCSFNQQCLGNSQCSNGFCQCPSGSSQMNGQCTNPCGNNQVSINNQCYPTAQIGSSCSFNQQCLGNSQCSNGFCQCPSGSSQMNGQCTNPCGNNQVSINNQCYPTAQIGSSCSFNQQCLGNSQCSNGFCQCPSGSSQMNGQCNPPVGGCKSYQVRNIFIDVFITLLCFPVLSSGICYDKVSIGQSCRIAAQCEVQGQAVCSSTCRCSAGSFNGTHCLSSVSTCTQGTVLANSRCLSLVQLNQYCQFSAQCLGFGVCTNSFCVCPSNFVNINGTCRSDSGTSICSTNQIAVGGVCYNLVPPGQACSLTAQCTGYSTCQNSICRCLSNMFDYGDGICRNSSADQSNICEAGEEPAYSNGQLNNCLYQACPTASYCKLNTRLQQYICCKRSTSQIPTSLTCSNSAQSVVLQNNQPLNCLYSNCPSNAHCEYNNAISQYICCKTG